jgi:hypothetical protein
MTCYNLGRILEPLSLNYHVRQQPELFHMNRPDEKSWDVTVQLNPVTNLTYNLSAFLAPAHDNMYTIKQNAADINKTSIQKDKPRIQKKLKIVVKCLMSGFSI